MKALALIAAAALLAACGSVDREKADMSDWERANYGRFARERNARRPQSTGHTPRANRASGPRAGRPDTCRTFFIACRNAGDRGR